MNGEDMKTSKWKRKTEAGGERLLWEYDMFAAGYKWMLGD